MPQRQSRRELLRGADNVRIKPASRVAGRTLSPRTAYKRGRAFEYRVRDHLRSLDYRVIRSPKSRGPFDLIAIGAAHTLLVQCKVGGYMSPAEWNELWALRNPGAICIFVIRRKLKLQYYELTGPKDKPGRQPMRRIILTMQGRTDGGHLEPTERRHTRMEKTTS